MPVAARTTLSLCAIACGGISMRSFDSASIMSGGSMSGLIDIHCPNFWKLQPAASSAERSDAIQRSRADFVWRRNSKPLETANGAKTKANQHILRTVNHHRSSAGFEFIG